MLKNILNIFEKNTIQYQLKTPAKGKYISGEPITWEFPKSLSFKGNQILYHGKAFGQIHERRREIHIERQKAINSKGINPLLSHTAMATNTKYMIQDGINLHHFTTDSKGRIAQTEHQINELYAPKRVNTEQTKALMCREEDMAPYHQYEGTGKRPPYQIRDEGGHILADSIGGLPESINIFPQAFCVNHSSEWRRMEKSIQTALKAGKLVKVKTVFQFAGSSKRPKAYQYEVTINGVSKTYQFVNKNVV